MSDEIEFEVDAHDGPTLASEGDVAPIGDELAAGALALGWTAEEVAAWLTSWWNVGCPWFGPRWAARPADWSALAPQLAPHFDEWFPKSDGAASSMIPLVLAMLGTGVTLVVKRSDVIREHWRRPWLMVQLERARQPSPAPGQASPAAPEPEPAPAPAGASYRLPRDLVRVAERPPDGLPHLGMP